MHPHLHGAGLQGLFELNRAEIPAFASDLFFQAFLIAFGEHVRATVQRDSDSHPVAHWWQGPNPIRPLPLTKEDVGPNPAVMFFADWSDGYAFKRFDTEGRQLLARNLAGRLFQVLEVYYATGANKKFLEKAAKDAGPDPLAEYIQSIPDDFDVQEHVIDQPTYRGLIEVDPRARLEKKKVRVSAARLANQTNPLLSDAERSKRYRDKKRLAVKTIEQIQTDLVKKADKAQKERERRQGKKMSGVCSTAGTKKRSIT